MGIVPLTESEDSAENEPEGLKMKIEVRNLKHMASLSEETHCYTATIYIDGQKAFEASNHGHGGPDMYHPVKGYTGPTEQQVDEWLKVNKPLTGQYADLDNSLEIEVGEQINAILGKRVLDRMLRTKLVVLVEDKQGKPALATYPAKFKPTAENIAKLKARGETVVNGDAALEQRALELV